MKCTHMNRLLNMACDHVPSLEMRFKMILVNCISPVGVWSPHCDQHLKASKRNLVNVAINNVISYC